MRFHIPGLAHTVSHPDYTSCAFTQKIVKLCSMLTEHGHEVYHYGNAGSVVNAAHEWITGDAPDHDWRKHGFPAHDDPKEWGTFCYQVGQYIGQTKEPGDFLLCSYGSAHEPIAKLHPDLICVEPGIGYSGGHFAPYKVFESYAILNAYRGLAGVASMSSEHWYDAVIPNFFDETQFDYSPGGTYLLFLGRCGEGKGLHIAQQIAQTTGIPLVIAGQGSLAYPGGQGVVGIKERRLLLNGARALICASTYVEPFGGVQVEAFLSGTPVISSDFGAFAEYNIHGETGYRCRTMGEFIWAAENIDRINPTDCWEHGLKFTMDAVYPQFEKYFENVAAVHGGAGWYQPTTAAWQLAPQ